MPINFPHDFGAGHTPVQERPCRFGERTSRQVDVDFVGKDKESAPGHAFGYETPMVADKPFSRLLLPALWNLFQA